MVKPKKNYLVTGGAGFIGSHLCDALLDRGHGVTVLDDLSTGNLDNLPNDASFVRGDCGDIILLNEIIPKVDGIFHLAAVASVHRSKEEWSATHRVNQSTTITILDSIAKNGRKLPFVFASSAAVFGDPDSSLLPLNENAPLVPLSPYGADKAGCELHARAAQAMHGIPTMGFRLFNVYGPRQDPSSPYSGVISVFIDLMQSNKPIVIFGNGNQTRDFIYVSDVVSYLMNGIATLEANKSVPIIFHACTGTATSILQLVETLGTILRIDPDIQHLESRVGDIHHSLGDNSLLKEHFNVINQIDLLEGLTRTLAI